MQDTNGQPVAIMSNQVARARHDLNVQEQRVLVWLICQIKKGDTTLLPQIIRVNEFAKLIGRDRQGSLYGEIEALSDSMMKKVIHIHVEGDAESGRRVRRKFQWLTRAEYRDDKGEIVLTLHPDLAPFVFDLQRRYTSISQHQVFQLRSRYAIMFYEACVSWRSKGFWSMSVDELREWLHIPDKEFPRVANLRQRVIETAKKELSEKSDHWFSYKPIKDQRNVVGWQFKVHARRSIGGSGSIGVDDQPDMLVTAPEGSVTGSPSSLDNLITSLVTDPPPVVDPPAREIEATVAHSHAPRPTLDSLAHGRERLAYDDLQAIIFQMFDNSPGKAPFPLNDAEKADLLRHLQYVSPEDMEFCVRYRRLPSGRSEQNGGRMVQHVQRRSAYISKLNEEIEKARQFFRKGSASKTSFTYGPAVKAVSPEGAKDGEAAPSAPEGVVLPPSPVVSSLFKGLRASLAGGVPAPQTEFDLPGFDASENGSNGSALLSAQPTTENATQTS